MLQWLRFLAALATYPNSTPNSSPKLTLGTSVGDQMPLDAELVQLPDGSARVKFVLGRLANGRLGRGLILVGG